MNDFLNDLPLLVEVARQKSFTKAADILGIGASTLSRRIRLLEEKMGVLLFYRDTRNVELTTNGSLLIDRCEFILTETRHAYDSVIMNMLEPSGWIRVCVFSDSYNKSLKEALCEFAGKWPDIRIHLSFVEHPVDMRVDPYDIAFQIEPSIAAPLVARKLMTIEPFLYASPDFFKRFPKPAAPQDLHGLPCITLERFGSRWVLEKEGRQVILEMQPHYTFSSVELCRAFVIAGHGIALLRGLQVAPDEKEGRLVRVLPEWTGFKHDLKLVTAPGQLPRRVRLFIEHMQACYSSLNAP